MLETLRDLVPDVTLYKDPYNGVHHAQPTGCAGTKDTLPEDLTITTILRVLDAPDWVIICSEGPCRELVSSEYLYGMRMQMDLYVEMYETTLGTSAIKELTCLSFLTDELRYLREGTAPSGSALTRCGADFHKALKDIQDHVLQRMRTKTWQDALHHQISLHEEDLDYIREHPEHLLLGDRGRLGLLVGPRNLHEEAVTSEILLSTLCTGTSDQVSLIAPMSTLMWILGSSEMNVQGTYLGKERQVVPLPEDLTPEVLETTTGMFDPTSKGVLSTLPGALEAARLVCEDRVGQMV